MFGTTDPNANRPKCHVRTKNLLINNYRGIFGFLVPAIVIPCFINLKPDNIVMNLWGWMFWSFLMTPVSTPVTACIPIFAFPFLGIINSNILCKCYFNDVIALMIIGGFVALSINNSGIDKRIILGILSYSKSGQISLMSLLVRSSLLAYFLSMFSRHTIITANITIYVSSALNKLPGGATDPVCKEIRYIVCCAIFSSSAIGSTAIMNASYPTLCAAAVWGLSEGGFHDVFNFFDYSLFAFPTSFCMFIVNLIYFCIVLTTYCKVKKKEISGVAQSGMMSGIKDYKKEVPPKIQIPEIFSLLAVLCCLALHFTRRNSFFTGWAKNGYIGDATVSTIFCLGLHLTPSNLNFLRILSAKKRSQMVLKPAPGMLTFRYVDMNTYWGYLLIVGSAIALNLAVQSSGAGQHTIKLAEFIGKQKWIFGTLIILLITMFFSWCMPGTAALVILFPFFLNLGQVNGHLIVVGMGIAGSLGFTMPFTATPGYHCHKEGKVPIMKMIKYGLLNSILCTLVLWLALAYLAGPIWGPMKMPEIEVTTAAAAASSPPAPA